MLHFRLYHLHPRTSAVVQADDFRAPTIDVALELAQIGLKGPAELWQRGRLIAHLRAEQEQNLAQAPITPAPHLVS